MEHRAEADDEGVKEKYAIILSIVMLAVVVYVIGAFYVFAYRNGLRQQA